MYVFQLYVKIELFCKDFNYSKSLTFTKIKNTNFDQMKYEESKNFNIALKEIS